MTSDEWVKQLEEEGYKDVVVHKFEPDAAFGEHLHEQATIHVILEGEITLTDVNGPVLLKIGDRYEIPAGTEHTAKCGPQGVTFIAGVK